MVETIKTNTKVRNGVIGGALALVLIILIIVCVSCSKKDDENEAVSDNAVVSDNNNVSSDTTSEPLTETTDEAILNLVQTYYKALEVGDSATVESVKSEVTEEEKIRLETKAQDIEYIDNIKVYTRPGMTEGTYIVYIYSEMKFVGIETKAPGLATTYVSTREDGSLYIDSIVDEQVMEYVKQVGSEQTIKDFFNQVATDYTNALEADEQLKNYLESMNQKLDDAVAARQQAAQETANAEQPAQEAMSTQVNETVTATTKVNVRASDSENADRIGQVEAGTTLTRYETRDNGWSKIDYNGQEGYIKSEFLQAAGTNEAPADQTADTQSEESTEPEQTAETTEQATGKVTVKEAVRVRASASTDGEYLGSAYQGETYDLIMEQADGWCKINYNGQTAYIKTEFVEIN